MQGRCRARQGPGHLRGEGLALGSGEGTQADGEPAKPPALRGKSDERLKVVLRGGGLGSRPEEGRRAVGWEEVSYRERSRSVLSKPLRPHGLLRPWDFPGKSPGVGGHLPTQGSSPGLPPCRQPL